MTQHLGELSRGVASKIQPEVERLLSNLRFLKIDSTLDISARAIDDPSFTFNQEALYKVKTNEHLSAIGIGDE